VGTARLGTSLRSTSLMKGILWCRTQGCRQNRTPYVSSGNTLMLCAEPLAIYIDMIKITGTINVRLLLSATPPFVRNATISFPKLPYFEISAKPLIRSAFNAMGLPGMRSYGEFIFIFRSINHLTNSSIFHRRCSSRFRQSSFVQP